MTYESELEYTGFWRRLGAALIDTVLLSIITLPVLSIWYGSGYWEDPRMIKGPVDFMLSWVLPTILVIALWAKRELHRGRWPWRRKLSTRGPVAGRQLAS